jgi:hypothetical protein
MPMGETRSQALMYNPERMFPVSPRPHIGSGAISKV